MFLPEVLPGARARIYFDTQRQGFYTTPTRSRPQGARLDVLEMLSNSQTAPYFTMTSNGDILFVGRRIGLHVSEAPPPSMRSLPNRHFGSRIYILHNEHARRIQAITQNMVSKGARTGSDPLRRLQNAGYDIVAEMPVE